jgi:hypothetical protein
LGIRDCAFPECVTILSRAPTSDCSRRALQAESYPREVVMKRRSGFFATACLLAALVPVFVHAQAKPATTTTPAPAPAAPAKWVPPVKGEATIDFWAGKQQIIKGEIVTPMKVKNTSKGSIALLSVEEIWYNTKREIATNGTFRNKALLNPGDVLEFKIVSPNKPNLYTNMYLFKHANGTIKPNKVPKL